MAQLDHLFICTEIGAAIAHRLVALGLTEASSNVHPGQGTANRRFFFHNVMLELLWVDNIEEAQSEAIRRTRLGDRWVDRHRVCPFGICLRPGEEGAVFDSWAYHPPYLPEMSIAVGNNSENLMEPMLFEIPFGKRPDQLPPHKAQPLAHPIGWREMTRLTIVSPVISAPSPEFQALLDGGFVTLEHGGEYCVELGFDRELQGQRIDLRPDLPLVMSW